VAVEANSETKQKKGRKMNPMTQFQKISVLLVLSLLSLGTGTVLATPPSGVTTETVGAATFEEMDVHMKTAPWKVNLDTKGSSDLNIVKNTVVPGGTFGWHTHPGPCFVMVLSGAATKYEGDDPTCTPEVIPAGGTFVDNPGPLGHLVRNEGAIDLVVVITRLVPQGALIRIDVPNPGYCPEIN
jgi:quercetin dioxygenase-like cupin family protein